MTTAPASAAVGRRSAPGARWGAGVLACVMALVVLLVPVAALAVGQADGLGWKAVLTPWLLVVPGTLVVLGRPATPLGWLMLTVAGLFATSALAAALVARNPTGPGAAWQVWVVDRGSALLVPCTLAVLLLLPDGRLPSPAWRWPAAFALGAQTAVVAGWALASGPAAAPDTDLVGVRGLQNPVGVLPAVVGQWASSLEWLLQALLLLALPAVAFRVVRGPREQRRRLATVLAAVLAFSVLVVLGRLLWPGAADVLDVLGCALLAAALTSAVLTRQLPGVDVVVGHAVVYALLTALVAGTYVLAVALLGRFGSGLPAPAAGVLSAAIALALLPARGALQRLVDRLLVGDTADAVTAIRRLSESASGSHGLDELLGSVARTVRASVKASAVTVSADGRSATAGTTRPGGASHHEDLVVRGSTRGLLVVTYPPGRRVRARDRQLLRDFADHVARVVDTLGLTGELQRSRERLVAAREEERLRLRRDLHDELGPTLAGLSMQLGGLGELIADDPRTAQERVRRLEAASRHALDRVRSVSRGLRPPVLDELGLVAALVELAAHCGLDVDVSADLLPDLPPAVEVAAYRVGAEALTNVARHAGPTGATVRITVADRHLVLRVSDAGRGRGDGPSGVGTLAMRERAEELGGTLDVGWAPEGGTTVEARFPLEPPAGRP